MRDIWTPEVFEDDTGRRPFAEWLLALDSGKRAAVIAAIETLLSTFGIEICQTEHGKHLGDGLFELRIRNDEAAIRSRYDTQPSGHQPKKRREKILLRVFCHAYGEKRVLLLGGYDKGKDPSEKRQQREIRGAKKRLRAFKLRQARTRTGARRRQ